MTVDEFIGFVNGSPMFFSSALLRNQVSFCLVSNTTCFEFACVMYGTGKNFSLPQSDAVLRSAMDGTVINVSRGTLDLRSKWPTQQHGTEYTLPPTIMFDHLDMRAFLFDDEVNGGMNEEQVNAIRDLIENHTRKLATVTTIFRNDVITPGMWPSLISGFVGKRSITFGYRLQYFCSEAAQGYDATEATYNELKKEDGDDAYKVFIVNYRYARNNNLPLPVIPTGVTGSMDYVERPREHCTERYVICVRFVFDDSAPLDVPDMIPLFCMRMETKSGVRYFSFGMEFRMYSFEKQ